MSYPTPGAYQEALQHPATAFADPLLQAGEPRLNRLGLPQPITGAYAAVFPMTTPTGLLAVRCFLSEKPDLHLRYRALAAHLEAHPLPCTVPFTFEPEGIRIGEARYPILRMAWADGIPLNRFVARHLGEPAVLEALFKAWVRLLADLEAAGLAHGDLQHGNVLVAAQEAPGGRPLLRLVDYDTWYVPGLRTRKSPEIGHRNYQHPNRTEDDFDRRLDAFSGLVIGTALLACRIAPALWERFDTGENLLFQAADFYDPAHSPLFAELMNLEPVRPLAEALRNSCYLERAQVPTLGEVRAGKRPAPRKTTARPVFLARRPDHVRGRVERFFLPGLAAALIGSIVLLGLGYAEAAMLFAFLAGAACTGSLWWGYHKLPGERRRRRLMQEARFLDEIIDRLRAEEAAALQARKAVLEAREDARRGRLRELQEAVLEDRLKHHFIAEVTDEGHVGHKVMVRLKAAGIRTAYQATAERLAAVRDVGPESRHRIEAWRARLVARYGDQMPLHLSPAEEYRLERILQARLDEVDREQARLQNRIAVQEAERAKLEARLAGIPFLSFGRYVRTAFRLADRPAEAPLRLLPDALPRPPRPIPSESRTEQAS